MPPLVEPGLADPQRRARGRVRDPCFLWATMNSAPGPAHRLVHPETTERLRTSRCIRNSITSRRNRSSSARSSGSRERFFLLGPTLLGRTSFPACPSRCPDPRATCAVGLPVSTTSCTAPRLKYSSNFRYFPLRGKPRPARNLALAAGDDHARRPAGGCGRPESSWVCMSPYGVLVCILAGGLLVAPIHSAALRAAWGRLAQWNIVTRSP